MFLTLQHPFSSKIEEEDEEKGKREDEDEDDESEAESDDNGEQHPQCIFDVNISFCNNTFYVCVCLFPKGSTM